MIDRRRRVRWVNFIVSGVLAVLGGFALFADETGFTKALARQGIEIAWGVLLLTLGVLHACVACNTRKRPRMLDRIAVSTTLIVWVNGVSVVVMFWTWFVVTWLENLFTPTVAMCLWIGAALAVITLAEARSSCRIRKAQDGDARG